MLAAAALALAFVPAPAAQIIEAGCPDASGHAAMGACAYPDGRVYLPAGSTPYVREHELGHVFDHQRLDDGERRKLQRLMGLRTDKPWRQPGSYHGASERFADIYAACRLKLDPGREWETSYDYIPSRRVFRNLCAVTARAAVD